ncbi:MAG: DUF3071 domain-containing protein [Acidobacteria bacterium]|nr:DUF3071 domain-containing protein [Acidobacteriota bacterium]
MNKKGLCLIIFLLLLIGCSEKPQPTTTKPKAEGDPKRAKFQRNIDETSAEGKEMIEKVKAMKPEVNEKVSAKTLGEIIEDYATNKGDFNIKPIGWAASKKATNNWKIVYYYQDYSGQYTAAEWEYNPETKKLYPFEFTNAPTFYTDMGAANSNSKAKK